MRKFSLVSCFSFVLCHWLYLIIPMPVVSGHCREDQRSLLLQLKNNLTFEPDSSNKLKLWNQSIACCQWKGVSCDKERKVIGLDLSDESISGGFDNSSSLFSLRHLQHLNLSYNNFNLEIPTAFNKLQNLTYLNLAYAGFVGQIPIEISQLTRLVTLDLSTQSEQMKLENPSLGKLVQNLTKIRQLYLDGVSITGSGHEWQAALLQIPTLQELSMVSCNLSGPLHSYLTRIESLSVIYLDYNNFSSPVPESFAYFKNLTTLKLAGCELIGTFPQKIFRISTLSYIDISTNEDLHGFFRDFPINGSLQTLFVSNTNFSGPLPNSIGNLRHLSTLDLSSSQFSGTLPTSISNLTQLVDLDLSGNSFAGSISSLGMCKNLQRIFLSDNNFTGAILAANFKDLSNLSHIDLRNNFFSGMIPSSTFTLPSLQSIHLSNNEFEGQLNDIINASTRLQSLDLSGNHLEGPIPISMFQLTNLEVLVLSSNKFSGTIELNMLRKLGNLTTLDLSDNNLTIIDTSTPMSPFPLFPSLIQVSLASCKLTTFPQFLKNHSSLTYIDLSNNHIAGTIPQWIWNNNFLDHINLSYNYLTDWEEPMFNNLSSLSTLDFRSNLLHGPLPTLPQSFIYLDFSSNNFSSIIPSKIDTYLSNTKFLSFASNNLQGNIPESICNAPNLLVLDLSNNTLTGTIPKCLIAMNGTLSILDLGRNKLNGTIDTFPGMCSLRTLHLNDNSLHGKLPKYLSNCAMLEILDIGGNKINGQFPCWLKNISTLRVLILRSNEFYGSLRCAGTKVAWPDLQIFDLASNNFGGKIPFSFFETWKAMIANENHGSKSKFGHLQLEVLKFDRVYYPDKVTITSKKKQMDLVKILTIFTAIDLSVNKFEGLIPEGFGQFNALYILNLSHNAFSGSIPSSFGNMKNLESLDLSNNNLIGQIPTQIAKLSFLSFLNLSCNYLVGKIPTGTQIQSFLADSFKGNNGLCGPPLSQNCSGDGEQGTVSLGSNSNFDSKNSIEWNFISVELGFTFGLGIVVLPLVFYRAWRIRYWKCLDDILHYFFPQLDFVYERHGEQSYRALRWNWKAYSS